MTGRATFFGVAGLLMASMALSQAIYRYQDDDGRWHYTDRPPDDGREAQITVLETVNLDPVVTVSREDAADGITIYADNEFHGAVEFEITLFETQNVGGGAGSGQARLVLPAAQRIPVLEVHAADNQRPVSFRYRFQYMLGTPGTQPDPDVMYRVPYAVGQAFPVSQAYPLALTHGRAGDRHAVDFAMPERTAVHAARGGTVVEIAYRSFSGGTTAADAGKANLVRIVHDDGTLGLYAHLALESVRVRPGDEVQPGQYIADSGNTGFSTGPHLHFAVQRNVGFSLESLPVRFLGAAGRPVTARAGESLQAY